MDCPGKGKTDSLNKCMSLQAQVINVLQTDSECSAPPFSGIDHCSAFPIPETLRRAGGPVDHTRADRSGNGEHTRALGNMSLARVHSAGVSRLRDTFLIFEAGISWFQS